MAEQARRCKGRAYNLVGSRSAVRLDRVVQLVPDLRKRDIYVAGPEEFVHYMVDAVASLGVPRDAIHFDEYALG